MECDGGAVWRFLTPNSSLLRIGSTGDISGILAFCFCLCCAAARGRRAALRADPFDQITLDQANGNALLKVKPLELTGRRSWPPTPCHRQAGPPSVDRAEKKYEVAWGAIRAGGTLRGHAAGQGQRAAGRG